MQSGGAVYILTNKYHTVFYTGASIDLIARMAEHLLDVYPKSFTARYNCTKLVYYELLGSMDEAFYRERQIKKYSRAKKIKLIEGMNPDWKDLYEEEVKKW